jgi:hypothetical protein
VRGAKVMERIARREEQAHKCGAKRKHAVVACDEAARPNY